MIRHTNVQYQAAKRTVRMRPETGPIEFAYAAPIFTARKRWIACISIDLMHGHFLVVDKPAQSFPVNCTVL